MIPRFVEAAIMFFDEKGDVQKWTGKTYEAIFQNITKAGYFHSYQKWHVDGFMLDYGIDRLMFMNADNATKLAQIMKIKMANPNRLCPQDLWP